MSVETIDLANDKWHELPDISQTIQHGVFDLAAGEDSDSSLLSYEEITRIFSDAHANRVEFADRDKAALMLDLLVDNPAAAFKGEFLQLEKLYDGRARERQAEDGTVRVEFCTQNHDKNTVDYLFTHIKYPSGDESFMAQKKLQLGLSEPTQYTVHLQNDQLNIYSKAYDRGRYHDVPVTGERFDRVLVNVFEGTIVASGLQFERTADERMRCDKEARSLLVAHQKQAITLY